MPVIILLNQVLMRKISLEMWGTGSDFDFNAFQTSCNGKHKGEN